MLDKSPRAGVLANPWPRGRATSEAVEVKEMVKCLRYSWRKAGTKKNDLLPVWEATNQNAKSNGPTSKYLATPKEAGKNTQLAASKHEPKKEQKNQTLRRKVA